MAAACTSSSEEIENFVTCSVCLCEFDEEIRKPKFLPCAHTLCLTCLKGIHKEFVINCPLCRKEFSYQDDVSSLPNNSYALHMLKLTANKGSEVTIKPNSQEKPAAWCLTCRAVANKPNCATHSTVEVSANTIKNFESFMKLKEDLKKLKAEGETKVSLAIEKRKQVQAHLHQVSQCLKLVLHEVNQQEEQNNILLSEMICQLEPSNKVPDVKPISPDSTQVKEEDPHLSQLVSLINESKPDKRKSLEVLKEKMKKSLQLCDSKLADAVALANAVQYQKKSKISVRLADSKKQPIPTWGLLETGFDTYWPHDNSLTPTKRDFLLLSHIVFSIQKRGMKIKSKK